MGLKTKLTSRRRLPARRHLEPSVLHSDVWVVLDDRRLHAERHELVAAVRGLHWGGGGGGASGPGVHHPLHARADADVQVRGLAAHHRAHPRAVVDKHEQRVGVYLGQHECAVPGA